MSWVALSIIAYALIAFQVILDKFMLSSRRVAHPASFAFYTGVLSLFTLFIFLPFGGVHAVASGDFFRLIFSGIIFTFGIVCIFFAIQKSQASQVIPVSGAAIPIATYLVSLIFFGEILSKLNLAGIACLIMGGLLISFDLPLKFNRKIFFAGFYPALLGGGLLGIAFAIFKEMYSQDNFANVFVWTRLGLFLGALLLFLVPIWKKEIISSFRSFKNERKQSSRTGLLFVFNKILGGTGSLLLNYAIALGSVTVVNALIATEYVFVLIFGLLFSFWQPKIFAESGKFWDVAQKAAAIAIISAGVFLISK